MCATAEKVVPRSIPTALRLLMCFLEALWIRCLVCEATQCSFRASSFNPERLFFSARPSRRREHDNYWKRFATTSSARNTRSCQVKPRFNRFTMRPSSSANSAGSKLITRCSVRSTVSLNAISFTSRRCRISSRKCRMLVRLLRERAFSGRALVFVRRLLELPGQRAQIVEQDEQIPNERLLQ